MVAVTDSDSDSDSDCLMRQGDVCKCAEQSKQSKVEKVS